MHLFYVEEVLPFTTLNEEESRHFRVLRIGDDEEVLVSDGKGTVAKAILHKASKKQIILKTFKLQNISDEKEYSLTIAIAPTKHNERIEWFIEKSVEIGIDKIIFINTKNTERNKINIDRFKKIAKSAGKQSLTPILPVIEGMVPFQKIITDNIYENKHIALCNSSQTLKEILLKGIKGKHIVLIGPEGGFTDDEVQFATNNGWCSVLLSHKRLRTETAGIFVAIAYSLLTK